MHSLRMLLLGALAVGTTVGVWACGDEGDVGVGSQDDSLRKGKKKPRACGARLGNTCRTDEFCDWTLEGICGFADATGVCKPKPELCATIYDPVCGCDGETYGNACEANSKGVSVQSLDACPGDDAGVGGSNDAGTPPAGKICGGIAGLRCEAGQFCNYEKDAGGLGCGVADGTGVCEATPTVCTRIYAPVCGCDGKTYGNECEAHGKGVSIASEGECGTTQPPQPDAGSAQACGGWQPTTCPRGQFCNYEPTGGGCGIVDVSGVCERVPEICTAQYDPVCGCDGKTYSNVCSAAMAGASVAKKGECAKAPPGGGGGVGSACGGLQGLACKTGLFCNFEGDPSGVACGAADGTGKCQEIPGGCTLQYDPVCGCDDKTYGNACAAHAAGVSVAQKGECGGGQMGGPVSCDPRKILCKRAPPKCPGGTVPSVVGTCYGDCVPAEQCTCSDAPECPLPDEYTCHRSRMRCGPYVN